MKKGVVNRDANKRQFLEDWVLDPSFAKSKFKYITMLETHEGESSEEEVYTEARLEHKIGKKETQALITKGLLEPGKDKYGQDGWKYTTSRKRRGALRKRQASLTDQMDVKPEQSKRIREGMMNVSVGLSARAKKSKPTADLTPEQQKQQDTTKALKKMKTTLATNLSKCETSILDCQKSKHPVSKKMKSQMEGHLAKLKKKDAEINATLETMSNGKVQQGAVDKLSKSFDAVVDAFKMDLNIAKSV